MLQRGTIHSGVGSATRQLYGGEAVGPVVGARLEALSVFMAPALQFKKEM